MRRVASRLPLILGSALACMGALAEDALAQVPPAPAPAGAPPAPAPAAAPPAAATPAPAPPPAAAPDLPPPPGATSPPPPPAPVVAPATPLPLPPTVPPPPPAPASTLKPLSVGGAVRIGFLLQDPSRPKRMSEIHFDNSGQAYSNAAELRLHGDVTDFFSWTANFNAILNGADYGSLTAGPGKGQTIAAFGVEDLIAQLEIANEFQIWAGRLLVPSDRANFSGPFFI